MTDPAPLTDGELAEIETRGVGGLTASQFSRLVSDLRATRAEFATYKELVWGNECGCVGSAFRQAGVSMKD